MHSKLENLAQAGDERSLTVMALQLTDLFVGQTGEASIGEKHNFDHVINSVCLAPLIWATNLRFL